MDKDLDFNFKMLTHRQLLKLASAYNVYIQGAMPNNKTPYEDLLKIIENGLEVTSDGTIKRRDDKSGNKEASFLLGSGIRVIII
jgi:uncharacterized protein YfbU (UPF0304 family)